MTAFGRYAPSGRNGLDDRKAFFVRTRLVHDFRQIPFLDPGLPENLVPTHGKRARAVDLFHELYGLLAEPAHRHFDLAFYEDGKENGEAIYERLADGSMPCDEAWPDERVHRFRDWIDAGMPP